VRQDTLLVVLQSKWDALYLCADKGETLGETGFVYAAYLYAARATLVEEQAAVFLSSSESIQHSHDSASVQADTATMPISLWVSLVARVQLATGVVDSGNRGCCCRWSRGEGVVVQVRAKGDLTPHADASDLADSYSAATNNPLSL
jgi:hypothetical protein